MIDNSHNAAASRFVDVAATRKRSRSHRHRINNDYRPLFSRTLRPL